MARVGSRVGSGRQLLVMREEQATLTLARARQPPALSLLRRFFSTVNFQLEQSLQESRSCGAPR
ncbi:MAG: hypothetical protein CM15mP77_2160 [Synechococcus sp.]|nr:MAG: hypothetical protein CM15mP77_2160 [Synechococcus sp.]